jgi:stage III sporulation protein AF
MDVLRGWVISLCATLIFMTAVEMILPDNSTKKYVKFVLGLILIAVIINPFIRLFTKNSINVDNFITKYENAVNVQSDNDGSSSATEERFFSNLEKNCEELIKKDLNGTNTDVKIIGKLDMKDTKVDIDHLEVYVGSDGSTDDINKNSNDITKKQLNSSTSKQIKSILSKELNIDEKKIYVYKGE